MAFTSDGVNPLLPANSQSWTYDLAAGADFSAVDFRKVMPLASLGANSGSLLLGKNYGAALLAGNGATASTTTAVATRFQVIRTGSGDINIFAGRNVELLNQWATIYTAGVQVPNPTSVVTTNDFSLPVISGGLGLPSQGSLGAYQQNYPIQYSMAGGNVTIKAQQDIGHYTLATNGTLIADSSRQLPMDWLYRRGDVNSLTGTFSSAGTGSINDPSASTTWWVDFSNFFEDVGASEEAM